MDRLPLLADLLPEPMVLVATTGAIVSANRAFAAMSGMPAADVAGRNLRDLFVLEEQVLPEYLRYCAATDEWLPGGFTVPRSAGGSAPPARVEGVRFPSEEGPQVLLRFVPRRDATLPFAALTQKIDELTAEVIRRRDAEEALSSALEDRQTLLTRLAVLTEAAGSLFASLSLADVTVAIGRLALRLLPADALAVWQRDPSERWQIAWSDRLDDAARELLGTSTGSLRGPAGFAEPLLVSDVKAVPMLGDRQAAYAALGVASMIVIPLRVRGDSLATIAAYFRSPVAFTDADRHVAAALGNLGSSAFGTALLYEEQEKSRAASEVAERRAAFLAGVGGMLGGSLDYEQTLATIATLAVPEIADWCAVDVLDENGTLKRLAVAHVDPARVGLARAIREQYPEDPQAIGGVHHVVRTRTPVLIPDVSEDVLRAAARDERHLLLIRELGLVSYMCVPLVAHGRSLGALTFASSDPNHHYTERDLRFAEDVASRAALAVENARAYGIARRANRMKDEFLATLSHELRTPLNAVLGYTRMLRTGILPPERHATAIETIERNAGSLAQLVEDVLDVSRIEEGKLRLHVQQVDLGNVVAAAVETVTPAALAKGVRLERIVDPSVSPVVGDPERLQQVAWNLLSNAVKFTPRNGRVQIRLARVSSHVELAVSDTGIGIHREFLPHVFERFQQEDSRPVREHGGLGLGLAITRHLVEMHGGTISVGSDGEGRGATFVVRLPLAIVQSGAPTGQPPAAAAVEHGALAGVRVLAVDDDADALELVRQVLESAGAIVTAAGSGPQALEELAAFNPDVLICDLGMPGMDGFALVERIRTLPDPSRRWVPVAALTAMARTEDRTRVLRAGFQMHLAKPINPAELTAAVVALTQRTAGNQ